MSLWGIKMSQGITFRSSVNGFNRNEVINYVEGLLKEKEELLRLVEELRTQCGEKDDALDILRSELAEEKKKCSSCDVASRAEAKLGSALLEAKRFSEELVREAEERCSEVYSDASEKATLASEKADEITDSLNETLSDCTNSVNGIIAAVNGIKEVLDNFRAELSESGTPDKSDEDGTSADDIKTSSAPSEDTDEAEEDKKEQTADFFDGDIFADSPEEYGFLGKFGSDGEFSDDGFVPDFDFDDDSFTVKVDLDD